MVSSSNVGLERETADVVVVGAGPGGLAAAAALAAAGRRVIVVEGDRHLGGTTRVFSRRGYVFPVGPLSFTAPADVARMLDDLGVKTQLTFERDVFQVVRGELDEVVSVPLSELNRRLAQRFPGEAEGIRRVSNELRELGRALRPVWPGDDLVGDIARRAREPAREMMERELRAPVLRDLFGSQGTTEPVMSMGLLARMWDFMSELGIWYPSGGIDSVPRLLFERLRDLGGTVRTGERVEEIILSGGSVAGVRTNRAIVRCPWVVAACDQRQVFEDLVPRPHGEDRRAELAELPLSGSAFTLFLGVNPDELELSRFRGHHMLVRLSEDPPVPWTHKRPVPIDFRGDELSLSWWSRHDRRLAPFGRESLVVRAAAPYDAFAPLAGPGKRRHSPQYYRKKEEYAEALLHAVEEILPGLRRAVEVREVATPITYRFWGHRSMGSIAGWSWRAEGKTGCRSLVETPVPGLLTSGVQAATCLVRGGVGTSIMTGLQAAERVRLGGRPGGESDA